MKATIASFRLPWHVIRYAEADHSEIRDTTGETIGTFRSFPVASRLVDIINYLYFGLKEDAS